MRRRNKDEQIRFALLTVRRYVGFFFLMAFVISCCMLLFLNTMSRNVGLTFVEEDIALAAKLTFANILLLSFFCSVIDGVRRKFMVDRPVKQITSALDRMIKGDLNARVQPFYAADRLAGFDIIADYINRMAEELSGMETLRTDFLANVSHELKTPLAVMQNYGTMLQQPDLPEEKRKEYAKAIADASHSLANMVSNILKLNKLENQKIYPTVQKYDLGEQLCECLLAFEDVWENKNLGIDTALEENVQIAADPELLSLVWNNLFSNAIKFTEPGGKISLALEAEGDFAVVKISDTGCGISQEVGKHIFEKFYQGDTSHATKGNGLGLALVKRVVDIMGGDIAVESEVGKGSTFTVRIRREMDAPA